MFHLWENENIHLLHYEMYDVAVRKKYSKKCDTFLNLQCQKGE